MASAFDHFLLHTGGRGILDELEKELSLAPDQARAHRLLLSLSRLSSQPWSICWASLADNLHGVCCAVTVEVF